MAEYIMRSTSTVLLIWSVLAVICSSCDPACPDCPCFSQSSYTLSLPDNIPSGTHFITITGSSSLHLPVTHTLAGSTHFTISPAGALSTRVGLDYSTVSSYTLMVRGRDSAGNIGTVSMVINLVQTGSAPNLLVCTSTVISAHVLEGVSGAEYPLPTCFNSDGSPVSAADLSSTINSGNIGAWFSLSSLSQLSNIRPLDYETQSVHTLQVGVANSETPPLSNIISVIVTVNPYNEFPPVFAADPIQLSIPESHSVGGVVDVALATDQDQGGGDGTLTYSLILPQGSVDGTDPVIAISPVSGQLILVAELDYEIRQNYSYTIVAYDNPSDASTQRNATASLILSVLNVNDNPPTFTHAAYAVQVLENAVAMATITTVTCNDPDVANSDLTYSITQGNVGNKFSMDPTSGRLQLRERIDFDDPASTTSYTLTVACQEVAPPHEMAEALVVVEITSVNEYAPDPGSTYQVSLREDTPPGSVIVQVRGRDRDRGLAGELRYFLFPPRSNPDMCRTDLFYIHSTTGAVYVIEGLDYESGPLNYHCVVSVWDSQQPIHVREQDIFVRVIDINDAPPVCNELPYRVKVPEDASIGAMVVDLSCTDLDSTTLQYAFTDSSAPLFRLDQRGSVVLNQELDFEARTLHVIHIRVSDGEYSVDTTVFMTVTNVNEYTPTFAAPPLCSVAEDAIQGTPVCTLQATDNDQGQDGVLRFSIISAGVPLAIQPESGNIFVSGSLDADTTALYTIRVMVTDLGTPPRSSSMEIAVHVTDVNDNHPNMPASMYVSLPESASPGDVITTLTCTDSDASRNNSDVRFQLGDVMQEMGDGTLGRVTSNLFELDAATGVVTLAASVDYESIKHYVASVLCADQGSPRLETTGTLDIRITAVNEFPPVFSPTAYAATIPESVQLGTSILTVTATDADDGIQGDITYRIGSGAGAESLFWIHSQTGVIVIVGQPQCHMSTLYSFQVVASDGATPPREARGEVTIEVNQCHLGTLIPTTNILMTTVVENTPPGEVLVTVACTSSRTPGATPNYLIMQQPADNFEIDIATGEIRVHSPPDYEEFESHLLSIRCYDPHHADIRADMTVQVSIEPVNEHAPVFDQGATYILDLLEDSRLGSSIGIVSARDRDRGRDGEVVFSVSAGSEVVLVDRVTGVIVLAGGLDREAQEEVQVTITARDSPALARTTLTTSLQLVIRVLDVNDNWPVCNRTVYHVAISPLTTPTSTILSDLSCTDSDAGVNSDLRYSLADFTEDKFSINPVSGAVTLAKSLSPQDAVAYNVPLVVADSGLVPYSVTVLVIVDLRQSPPVVQDGNELDSDYKSLVEEEGLKNSVSITLNDFSKAIWEESFSSMNSFHEAVAHSVTGFCALYPQACSLVYGCSNFYGYISADTSSSRTKRQATPIDQTDNYANFAQPHVVILSDMTSEFSPSSADNSQTSLRITFYVRLPDRAERSPSRSTNYVVPKSTLSQIVSQDGGMISAVVRNSATPSLTSPLPNEWRLATIVIVSILSFTVGVATVVATVWVAYKIRGRKKNQVSPFSPPKSSKLSPKVSTSSTKTTSSTDAVIGSASTPGSENKIRSGQPPPHLAHFFSSTNSKNHSSDIPPRRDSHDSNSTSRKSSSNSSSLSKVSMANHTSRRGSVSVHRSGDYDLLTGRDKMEEFEDIGAEDYGGGGEEVEEYTVPFPLTRPTKQVKPPLGNWWSSSMH